jgi:hypothetical protein
VPRHAARTIGIINTDEKVVLNVKNKLIFDVIKFFARSNSCVCVFFSLLCCFETHNLNVITVSYIFN